MLPNTAPPLPGVRRHEPHMGTVIGIDIRDDRNPVELDHILDQCFAEFARIEDVYSTFRPQSVISRLGCGELALEACDPEVREVLARCEKLRTDTQGAFDHRPVGGRVALDPAGVVKGWSVDTVGELLLAADIHHWCINAGGDVACHGGSCPGRPWSIGVRHPFDAQAVALVLEAPALCVATTAIYERGNHLWGNAGPADYVSATVMGPELWFADACAKVVWTTGPHGITWVTQHPEYDVAVMTAAGQLLTTPGVSSYR